MQKLKEIFLDEIKRNIILLVLAGISLILSFFDMAVYNINTAWIAIILCGTPIVLGAAKGLITEFDIKADVLVALALIASIITGEIFAAGEVAFIMQIGALLEELTVAKARAGIEKIVELTPASARIIRNGQEVRVKAEDVKEGDTLRVLAGETIAVDGQIISGQTSVNEAVMTGESMPVDKSTGDEVFSGTVNQFGTFEMKATKVGEDSSIQRMIRLVESADAGKAKIVNIADRWATWIVIIAVSSAVLTGIFTKDITRAVTILVVFCPCALVLATPTAIMAAIGNATKYGILVREGDALERMADVKKITFDKTGTLTYGTPKVISVVSCNEKYKDNDIYRILSSAEKKSEHPIGKAIVKSYQEVYEMLSEAECFELIPGQGVSAEIEGKKILAGNIQLLKNSNIITDDFSNEAIDEYLNKGCTVTYISIDEEFSGFCILSDTLRKEAAYMINQIKSSGVSPVLLTGDHMQAGNNIALKAGITEMKCECLPEDKMREIDQYQKNNQLVCMVGDGINDAPALKQAHVGVAMGGIGSDIAVEAADIALISDDISKIPHLIGLSKKMMTTIKINMSFSMILNFAAIILAMTGILNPVVGALVHNAGSVLVITNSALLLKWKEKINLSNSIIN